MQARYPKPGPIGGKLIRQAVSTLRLTLQSAPEPVSLPITAHILIAVSGGADSMALARLLVRYGRRVGDVHRIRLIHINHGWRGAESDGDEAFVRAAARRWGVPISVFRLRKPPKRGAAKGSPEELARAARKRIYAKLSEKYASKGKPAWIFTAHHADDLAETMVWRVFSGTWDSHGGGIELRHGNELRPLLRVRKRELVAFLQEEGEAWREDRTNFEGLLLRSKLRLALMPMIEGLFPRAVEHLARMAFEAQQRGAESPEVNPSVLFSASGLRVKRAHWNWLRQKRVCEATAARLSLPGGWSLRKSSNSRHERWILERTAER